MPLNIGTRLKQARESMLMRTGKKLSARALSLAMGKNVNYVNDIESRNMWPGREEIEKMAELTQVRVEWLVAGDPPMAAGAPETPEGERHRLVDMWRRLPPIMRENLSAVMDMTANAAELIGLDNWPKPTKGGRIPG